MDLLRFFYDPILRAPTLGSMLMCLASALVGVIVFIRKRSLIGEALSHAAYPGVVLGLFLAAMLFTISDGLVSIAVLVGGFLFSLIGLMIISFLERKAKMKSDAALCFVLAAFLGLGILFASRFQFTHPIWYKQIQIFLYGQAATMIQVHIYLYAILATIILTFVFFLFRQIQCVNFDRTFSVSIGIRIKWVDLFSFLLLSLAIIVGIRSVGVVLMSGMLIAPAAAARQLTHRLSMMFLIAALIGMFSGFFGNYLSLKLPIWLAGNSSLSLPTGPMIILVATFFALLALLFSSKRGLISRVFRMVRFRSQCRLENAIKYLWKKKKGIARQEMSIPFWVKRRLFFQGWIEKDSKGVMQLSSDGEKKAVHIVRLHRLWEVYLAEYLGAGVEKVHRNAEEIEHIITPELEQTLSDFLAYPKMDPHMQPIPEKGELS